MDCILLKAGGGVSSDELTAVANKVLAGYTYVGSDTDDEVGTGNIASLAGGSYKSGTSNKTIPCKGKYMTSDIVITGDSDLKAANIAKGVNILGVTGTHYGNKKTISAFAYRGFGAASSSDWETTSEQSFTLPSSGIVYYGGCTAAYASNPSYRNCTCEIYKNGTLVDERNIVDASYATRGSMFNQSFAVAAGDVVKVKCTATQGTHAIASIQAVIVY